MVSLNAFSGAAVLVEILRGFVPFFSDMNDERHFFWFGVFFVAFLALVLSGYLMMVRSFEK